MPIWAKTPGIVSVPMRPSVGATAPKRPFGVPLLAVLLGLPAAAEQAGAGQLLDADGEPSRPRRP